MQKLYFILFTTFILTACEQQDIQIQAANVIYNNCIENGEAKQWCRCLRADLVDAKKAFTEEMAHYVVNGRDHPFLGTTLLGARIRCECRMFPKNMAMRGLSCAGVKPIIF